MSVSFDTNILLYAHDTRDGFKHDAARTIMARLANRSNPLAGQVLSEFLAVNHRKHFLSSADAHRLIALIVDQFRIIELDAALRLAASTLALDAKIGFYDAQIVTALASHKANYLFSEDFNNGQVIQGVTVLNPFLPKNAIAVGALLS